LIAQIYAQLEFRSIKELKEGDDIQIRIADRRELEVSRKPGRDEILKRLRAFRGRLPADFKFDRDEANAR
jgi:antitoxin MazE